MLVRIAIRIEANQTASEAVRYGPALVVGLLGTQLVLEILEHHST